MGAKYERAYHSDRDSVNSYIFQFAENRRTSMAQIAGSSASNEVQGVVRYGRKEEDGEKG